MMQEIKAESDHIAEARATLLAAALPHVAFDGWSEVTLRAAAADTGLDPSLVKAAAPRGAIDLAAAFHVAGDRDVVAQACEEDLTALRYSARVARLVRLRIEGAARDREAVRRGVTLFALPIHAGEGARLIWGTADAIWTALGDTSDDYNWYSKRMILSGVYSSTVLFWLGDQSEGFERTWAFLDRRIEDVMRFEKAKAQLRGNGLARALFAGPKAVLAGVKPPRAEGGRAMGQGASMPLPGRRRG